MQQPPDAADIRATAARARAAAEAGNDYARGVQHALEWATGHSDVRPGQLSAGRIREALEETGIPADRIAKALAASGIKPARRRSRGTR